MRILVVDCDRTSRMFVSETLMAAGYRVTAVENGVQALDAFLKQPFPIVISELTMPEIDGVQLCSSIRDAKSNSYTYFILLTSVDDPEETCRALEAGADDYIVKPYNETELVLRVGAGRRISKLETRDMTLLMMQQLFKKRSSESNGHFKRIGRMATALASAARAQGNFADEIDGEFLDRLEESAWLHDIGKLALPDEILLKPGVFTEEERRLMQTHAVHGADIFRNALERYPDNSFLVMAREIALSHHEKYDGTGYPFGLKKDEIPLAARIVSLCDFYDALTSDRVYKEAVDHETAAELVYKGAGVHFDPELAAAFSDCVSEFKRIKKRWPDEKRVLLYKHSGIPMVTDFSQHSP